MFEKFIPAGGEAEVMGRVKGRYGNMKGSRRGASKQRFSRIRSGRAKRKPQTWIPLAAGTQTSMSNRPDQIFARRATNGSNDEAVPDQGWLWVISPELVGFNQEPSVVAVGGEADPDMQYTVAGMTGRLFWTPLQSLSDPDNDPAAWTGFIRMVWMKVRAIPDESGSQTPQYPWSGSWSDPVDSGPTHVQGLFPNYTTVSVNNAASQRSFALRDGRYRTSIIRRYEKPWLLDMMPMTWWNSQANQVESQYSPRASRPVQLPLPRKLVCNVGRGESLACAYQVVSQAATNSGSSPAGIFDFSDVKIKVYAHI